MMYQVLPYNSKDVTYTQSLTPKNSFWAGGEGGCSNSVLQCSTGEKTEVQRTDVICPKTHSSWWDSHWLWSVLSYTPSYYFPELVLVLFKMVKSP